MPRLPLGADEVPEVEYWDPDGAGASLSVGFTGTLPAVREMGSLDIQESADKSDAMLVREAASKIETLSTQDILKLAHRKLLVTLLAKMEAGVISHQEMATLRSVLRDNGMVLGLSPDKDSPKVINQAPIPSFERPDWED